LFFSTSLLNYVPLPVIIKEKKKDMEASHFHPGCHPTTPTCLAFNIMPTLYKYQKANTKVIKSSKDMEN